ncbi:MAG: hypothetical protein O3A59_00095 [Nitrospirae bacterium]|nr:hypothetical protein [Nitrospirota bacterium]
MNPIIIELALEWESKVTIGRVNVDQHPHLSDEYRSQSRPTFLLFRKVRWRRPW